MKRIIITGAVLLGTVSASLGLLANASFAQSAPSVLQSHTSVLDDRGGLSTHAEPGDDKGGLSTHAEPGDDKGGLSTHAEPGDDSGSHQSGSDDGPGHS
jgi:hypothetical protein